MLIFLSFFSSFGCHQSHLAHSLAAYGDRLCSALAHRRWLAVTSPREVWQGRRVCDMASGLTLLMMCSSGCRSDKAGTILRRVASFPLRPWQFSTPTSLLDLRHLHGLRHLAFCRHTDSGASRVKYFATCSAIPVTAACLLHLPVLSPLVCRSLVPSLPLLGGKTEVSIQWTTHQAWSLGCVGRTLRPRSYLDSV